MPVRLTLKAMHHTTDLSFGKSRFFANGLVSTITLIKGIVLIILLALQTSESHALAQSNWQTQSNSPGANYYAIRAAHEAEEPVDTEEDGEEDKYRRFDAFWCSRVETGIPPFRAC